MIHTQSLLIFKFVKIKKVFRETKSLGVFKNPQMKADCFFRLFFDLNQKLFLKMRQRSQILLNKGSPALCDVYLECLENNSLEK